MDRRFGALAGILGFTWWRSRKKRAVLAPPPPSTQQADPADELRAKLAEARDADEAGSAGGEAADARPKDPVADGDGGRDELESGEKPVDEAADVDAKRRDAHERARAAMDDLRPD